jgi:hypothetical protein
MKVRELLQTEIWSKRTSRVLLMFLLCLVVGYVLLAYVSDHWLTQREREAAGNALKQVDALEAQIAETDQQDFDAKKWRAQQATDAASKAALTSRDERLSFELSSYFAEVLIDRVAIKMDEVWRQGNVENVKLGRRMDPKLLSSEAEARRATRVNLRTALTR